MPLLLNSMLITSSRMSPPVWTLEGKSGRWEQLLMLTYTPPDALESLFFLGLTFITISTSQNLKYLGFYK